MQSDAFTVARLPGWLRGKESACRRRRCRRRRFDPWVRKVTWRRRWHPTPVLLPGESHGQRGLAGYSPWGRKNQTRLSVHTCTADSQTRACHLGHTPPSWDLTAGQPRGPCWCVPPSSLCLNHSLGNLLCSDDARTSQSAHSSGLCINLLRVGLPCHVENGRSQTSSFQGRLAFRGKP